jgi:hypothetical protein
VAVWFFIDFVKTLALAEWVIACPASPRYNPLISKEVPMAEQTTRNRKPFDGKIPEDVRKHAQTAREEMHQSFESLFPPEFSEHRRKARKEMLLAFRSLIDASLERMDKSEKKA